MTSDDRYIIFDTDAEQDRIAFDVMQDAITHLTHEFTDGLDDPPDQTADAKEQWLDQLGTLDRILSAEARGDRDHPELEGDDE